MRDKGSGSAYLNARGRWVATLETGWTSRGTRRRATRTAPPGATKRDALAILAQMRREDTETTVSGTTTVKTYADTWLPRQVARLRPSSYMVTSAAVAQWIIPTIGHKRIEKLTPGDIRAVSQAILMAGLAPSTASRYRGVLSKMLKDARLDGHRVPNVVDDVEGVPQGENDRDAIPLDAATKILLLASQRPDASRWAAALLEAIRPAEARGLTWACVDLDRAMLDISWQLQPLPYRRPYDRTSGFKVPVGYMSRRLVDSLHLVRPKTAHGRRLIPMVPWMVSALRAWRDIAPANDYNLVWSQPDGRPLDARDDREAWKDLCRAAGVDVPDLYEARHTTVTLLLEAGVSPEVIIAIVGHATFKSTRPYAHVREGLLREAMAAVADRFGLGVLADDKQVTKGP